MGILPKVKFADTVDVPGHKVTPKRIADTERTFEIDLIGFLPLAAGSAFERFGPRLESQNIARHFNDGQAAPGDGDAGSQLNRVWELAAFDLHAFASAIFFS